MNLLRCFSTATLVVVLLIMSVAGCHKNSVSQGVVIKSVSSNPTERENDADEPENSSGPHEKECEDFDSAKFSDPTTINNEWFPLKPGTQLTWEGTVLDDEGDGQVHWVVFTVTDLTRKRAEAVPVT